VNARNRMSVFDKSTEAMSEIDTRELITMAIEPITTNEVSAEGESKLWEASKQYMQGDIDLAQLEDYEKIFRSDLSEPTSLADYYAAETRSGISGVIDHVVGFMVNLLS
jgi:hypothetical protein